MPRIPIHVPLVSYSEIDSFRQCPFKHQLGYKERWKTERTSPALSRGTLWHQIMESHYRTLQAIQQDGDPEKLMAEHRDYVKSMLALDRTEAQRTEDQVLIEWMYRGYLDYYGFDEKEWGWEIIAVEHQAELWLPHPEGKRPSIKVKLKIDVIVRDPMRRIWIVDHKSGKDLPKQKELDLLDQFVVYEWALKSVGKDVFGSVHNAARTFRPKNPANEKPLDEQFSRTRMPRTPKELETMARELYLTAETAWRHYRPDPERNAPRAPDPDRCKWRCDFTEPCLLHRKQGGDHRDIMRQFGFIQDFTRH